MTLAKFTSYLSSQGMIDASKLHDDTDDGFDNRLKLQKYVYLARYFGLDLGYRYYMYLHGPYSSKLTKAYYTLDLASLPFTSPPSKLHASEFVSALKGKSSDWLEIGATILHEKQMDDNVPREMLYISKPDHTRDFIDSVYDDLDNLCLQ